MAPTIRLLPVSSYSYNSDYYYSSSSYSSHTINIGIITIILIIIIMFCLPSLLLTMFSRCISLFAPLLHLRQHAPLWCRFVDCLLRLWPAPMGAKVPDRRERRAPQIGAAAFETGSCLTPSGANRSPNKQPTTRRAREPGVAATSIGERVHQPPAQSVPPTETKPAIDVMARRARARAKRRAQCPSGPRERGSDGAPANYAALANCRSGAMWPKFGRSLLQPSHSGAIWAKFGAEVVRNLVKTGRNLAEIESEDWGGNVDGMWPRCRCV